MAIARSSRRRRIMKKHTRRTRNRKRQTRKKKGGGPLTCNFPYNTIKWDPRDGLLGSGAYGTTYVVSEIIKDENGNPSYLIQNDGTKKQYVLKRQDDEDSMKNEAYILNILSKLNYPNILKYVGCYTKSNSNDQYYIVTEYNPGYYDLNSYIYHTIPKNAFTPTKHVAKSVQEIDNGMTTEMVNNNINNSLDQIINNCITQLYEGLYAIHSENIFHSDIKPANIIINPNTGDIKYIDFGISNIVYYDSGEYYTTFDDYIGGTPLYMPYMYGAIHEYGKDKKGNIDITKFYNKMIWTDYWALAIVIYELIYENLNYFIKDNESYRMERQLYKKKSYIKKEIQPELDDIDSRLDNLGINHYIKVSQILFPTDDDNRMDKIDDVLSKFMKIHSSFNLKNPFENVDIDLCRVVHQGDINQVIELIKKGANVNIRTKDNYTPIHIAVYNTNIEIVKLLIDNKADVNIQNSQGNTPLHIAVDKNNIEIVQLLIEKGAAVNIQNSQGHTPLHIAVVRKNIIMSTLLIENGAAVNIQNSQGHTPLHIAVDTNNIEIVKLLIDNKADVNAQNSKDKKTPLHIAVDKNNIEIVKLLIDNKADVNAKANEDNTPLHIAVVRKNIIMSTLLIEKGAEVNAQNIYKNTPLIDATIRNSVDIVSMLIEKGADVNMQNFQNKTPLNIANELKLTEIINILAPKPTLIPS